MSYVAEVGHEIHTESLLGEKPTSGYDDQFLETTRRLERETAHVNGKHVSKIGVIESRDQDKADQLDGRAIVMVAEMDKAPIV